jgi:hypothetical protein
VPAGLVRQSETCRSGFWSTAAIGLAAVLIATVTSVAGAQLLREPKFVFEPGAITVNAISSPLPTGSSTGLNFRFLAAFSTPVPWLTFDVGTTLAPLGLSNGRRDRNEPTFFYGPNIMLLPRDRTRNWIEVSMPVLGAYRLDENGEGDRLYVNDLVVQGAMLVPLGRKLMADMGAFWSRLTLYGIVEQNLTPSRNFTTRKIDHFSPTFQYGVSIPLGGATHEAR